MRVASVNVGMPQEVTWQGEIVTTGIFKKPVAGRIALRTLNFDGDRQADLTVHGGPDKAVYAYPREHYPDWEAVVGRSLLPGAFGENLTTEGLLEDQVCIGDEYRIGTARMVVTQPRLPCYKLGLLFGDPHIIKAFLESRRPGIYFAVTEEGQVGSGDVIELVHRDERRVSVTDMLRLIFTKTPAASDLRKILGIPRLAAVWRTEFESRLSE
ncbi:MAG TPA: MOSC domain-containing protein [Pirellulales bacterium]|nr:MOSC domain-containing protein [Lacipirellulaceae bacterium]HVU87381.1 MOSC domain-containing protein [Pirellulales bacterium]